MHVDKIAKIPVCNELYSAEAIYAMENITNAPSMKKWKNVTKKERLHSILSEQQPQLNWNGGLSVSLTSKMKSFKFAWSAKSTATGLIVDSPVFWDAKLVASFFIVMSGSWKRISWIWFELFGLVLLAQLRWAE